MEETFIKEMTILFKEGIIDSTLTFRVDDIKKDFDEYCLKVVYDNKYEVEGLFTEADNKLRNDFILSNLKLFFKKENFKIKIYIKDYDCCKSKNKEYNSISSTKIKFNMDTNNIILFFKSLKLIKEQYIEEGVFLISHISNIIKVKNIITLNEYIIESIKLKQIQKFKLNEFIYIKHFSIRQRIIELNNISFLQKANDFQIFKTIEKQIEFFSDMQQNNDFYEFKPIKKNDSIDLNYVYSKFVLKNNQENFIIILGKFNRLIK